MAFLSQTQFGSICYAKTITVSNISADIAMSYNLQTTIDSADAGDVIYIFPSATSYGNITINKSLTLIGAGYNHKVSSITTITLKENSSNTVLYGLNITSSCVIESTIDSGYAISRCKFTGLSLNGETIFINSCIIYSGAGYSNGISINNAENVVISNNIFVNHRTQGAFAIGNSNKYSVLIENNIFFSNNDDTWGVFTSIANADFNNNILYKVQSVGFSNCNMNNNIVFNGADSLPYGDNYGENNIKGKDPEFIDMKGLTCFTFFGDYHLKDTSPGKNAGKDSTDIGIYGSGNAWPEDKGYTGQPPLPIIYDMNVVNKVVGENSKVRVKLDASKAK